MVFFLLFTNLSRYLKSLRSERKKERKREERKKKERKTEIADRKGQERKIGVAWCSEKSDYLALDFLALDKKTRAGKRASRTT